jgi:hypothetical protein
MRKLNLFLVICFSVLLFKADLFAVTITVSIDKNWSAITDGSGPGGQPGVNDDIIVGKFATLIVDVDNAVCASIQLGSKKPEKGDGTLTFENGSIVTVSGFVTLGAGVSFGVINMTNGGTLICQVFKDKGPNNIFKPGIGTVQLTSTHKLPSLFTNFNNLIINGGTITFSNDMTVNGILTFINGQIILGNNNLSMGLSGSISGVDNNNYIVTNRTGQLKQTVKNDDIYVSFPVGPTAGSYNPVKIKLDNTSTNDIFGVNVSKGITFPPSKPSEVIKREWTISEEIAGGSNATIQFLFGTADFGANFNPNLNPNLYDIGHFNSITGYDVISGSISGPSGNLYTLTNTSFITSFSPFIVGNYNSVTGLLPVELISFTAMAFSKDVKLNWVTATETNNSGFEIFRSSPNNNWEKVGYMTGNGTKTTPTNYSFMDKKLNTGKYNYRLKQIDYNGNFEYFNLTGQIVIGIPNKFDISQNYPNPFNPTAKIDFDLPYDSKVSLKLYDISGREVMTLMNETKAAGYYTVQMNGNDLSSGMYFYRINAEGNGQNYIMTKKAVLIK